MNNTTILLLESLASIYDNFLVAKGKPWCNHWESVPLNQLLNDNVTFKMPRLEDCKIAKEILEDL